MKIKTQFRTTMFLFSSVLTAALALIIITDNQAERTIRQEELAIGIAQRANELSYLSNDYLIYREDQHISRWQSRFDLLLKQTAGLNVDTPEEQMLVRNINENSRRLKETFDGVLSAIPNFPKDRSGDLNLEFLKISSSRLAVQTQGLFSDAQRLSHLIHDRRKRLREIRTMLIYILLGLFGLFLFTNYILTYRRTMRSMATLQAGAKVIGSGDLDFRIKKERDDEIGELSDAFNQMTAGLKTVTASKNDLEKEIEERKRVEEELRIALGRLQTFFDHRIGGIGIVIANAKGDIIQANDYYLTILGFTRKELQSGRVDWRQMTPPEWLPADERALAQLRERGVCDTYEKEYLRRDGSRVPVLITDAMMPGDSGDILAFILDITQRKQAEEALAAAHRQTQSLIDNTTAMVYACDLEERFVLANAALAALLRTTPAQLLGKRRHEFMPQADANAHEAADREVIATGRAVEFEEHSDLHGRSITWLSTKFPLRDAHGRIYGVAGIVTDISERKRAEEALRESEQKYRNLFENMAEEVHFWQIIRDEDGRLKTWRLVDANPPTLKSWGRRTAEEIKGKTTDEIFGSGATEHYMPIVEKIMIEGIPYSFEDYFPNLDKHFRFTSVPLGDYFITTGADITVIKQAQESLKASLAEKEVLLKEIHHRVKNNMQVISSLVSLQADQLQDAGMRAILYEMAQRVRSMAMVHEKLYQSHNLAGVEFSEYAKSLLNYLWRSHASAASAVRLTLDLEPVSLTVNTAVPCGLILNELVSNALKHAFRGRNGGEVTVSLHSAKGGVRLSVRDDGAGLPAGFDWKQAKSLGLRLVQMLAGQLHADVEVSSDRGTEFTIAFGEPKT